MTRYMELHPDRLLPADPTTGAFLSIPTRHDVARRIDYGFLSRIVAERRLEDWEAVPLAQHLTHGLVRTAHRL